MKNRVSRKQRVVLLELARATCAVPTQSFGYCMPPTPREYQKSR